MSNITQPTLKYWVLLLFAIILTCRCCDHVKYLYRMQWNVARVCI